MSYYEDRFDPTTENDYEPGQSPVYTKNANLLKSSSLSDQIKKADKNFYSIRTKLRNGTTIKKEYYASGPDGTLIRNAITGERYRGMYVGSKSEDLFFKVRVCNGETGGEAVTLFYENPEIYERHQRIELTREEKARWLEKQSGYLRSS